jgi:hypothetical protein
MRNIIAATAVALAFGLPGATTGFADSNVHSYGYFAAPQLNYAGIITGVCKTGTAVPMMRSAYSYGPFGAPDTCSVTVNGVLETYNPYGPAVIKYATAGVVERG